MIIIKLWGGGGDKSLYVTELSLSNQEKTTIKLARKNIFYLIFLKKI